MPHALLPERGVLRLSGADARDLLQGLITNNVDRLTPASAIYAALLSPQGKYLFDFFLSELDGDLLLDCEAARLGLLAQRLTLYKLRSAVKIEDASSELAVAVAFGEEALPALELPDAAGAARAFGGGIAYVDPRLAAAGARLILPAAAAAEVLKASGLQAASAEDYDAHRLALALPDGSRDLAVDKAILVESNFEALNGIDFKKGCYVGQELTARTKYRGLVRRRLLPVDVDGPLPEPETQVLLDGKDAGTVRSGRGRRALAVLRLEALEKIGAGEGELTAGGARLAPVLPGWADFELPRRI